MGPASWSVEGLCSLIDSGMNVARFNFSHGDHSGQQACLDRLREAISLRPGCNVAVLLDTKGPEIRTGMVDPSLNKLISRRTRSLSDMITISLAHLSVWLAL